MLPVDPAEPPVLLCGLGAFGQAVAARLLPSGLPLRVLDHRPPDWRTPQLQESLEPLLSLGDMRKPHVLRLAGVERARAVLLLSADSGANLEAALQVRLLNESAAIVVRSTGELDSLGSLLQQRLPSLVVVNPLQLSAGALVQALRPGPQLARFSVEGESFEIRLGEREDQRFQRPVRLENGESGLLVMPLAFYAQGSRQAKGGARGSQTLRQRVAAPLRRWAAAARRLLQRGRQLRRLPLLLILVLLLMGLIGVARFGGDGGVARGVFITAALLKGEYVDPTNVVLGPRGGPDPGDAALVAVTLVYSLVGTLLSSALVALLLDQLLLSRLGMRRARQLRRSEQPIVLFGGGALASHVVEMLRREGHAVLRVESEDDQPRDDRHSVFVPSLEKAVSLLGGREVPAAAFLSGQLLQDLQHLLQLQGLWPHTRFALLARSEGTGGRLGGVLGGAAVISPIEIGADVVVASAFGEQVEGVWRLQEENLLQVRYRVKAGDTLAGLTVSRLDHGYGLTVLTLRRPGQERARAMPSPGHVVAVGDELVVLAGLSALRRVEQGAIRPPAWMVSLTLPQPLDPSLAMTVRQCLARHLGLSPASALALLEEGERVRLPVDPDCGALLIRDLDHQPIGLALDPLPLIPAGPWDGGA